MQDTPSVAALRSTLQYTKSSTMPADHKVVLLDLLTQAIRDRQAQETQSSLDNAAKPWEEADTLMLQSFLEGKVATSWQHADELLVFVASRLGREPSYVRSRATDFGLGAGVDFRLARALMAERARAAED
jgi:hypothetical protein